MSLQDKVVLVTGGTSGIGEGCSRHFASLGAKLVIASNQVEPGRTLEQELRAAGATVCFQETDVSSEASVQAMVQRAVDEYGRVDGLHCNAGVWAQGKVTEFDEATWDKLMGVNVKGVLWCCKHAIQAMERSGGGAIVITTSVAAFIGFPEHALYCASKAALEALVRCLATDHAGVVRVNAVCPGTIDTPMLAASAAGWTKPLEELYADVAQKIPVRRLGQPLDVARAAAFLLSDEAGYINAASLLLDGGTRALPPW